MADVAGPEMVVTCVECEQVLSGGRCTNKMCPGYVPLTEAENERLLAHIEELEARVEELVKALGMSMGAFHFAAKHDGSFHECSAEICVKSGEAYDGRTR